MNVTDTHVMNEYEIMHFLYETGDFENSKKVTFKLNSSMSGNKRILNDKWKNYICAKHLSQQ